MPKVSSLSVTNFSTSVNTFVIQKYCDLFLFYSMQELFTSIMEVLFCVYKKHINSMETPNSKLRDIKSIKIIIIYKKISGNIYKLL